VPTNASIKIHKQRSPRSQKISIALFAAKVESALPQETLSSNTREFYRRLAGPNCLNLAEYAPIDRSLTIVANTRPPASPDVTHFCAQPIVSALNQLSLVGNVGGARD
jgi:hypothetical protein